MRLHACHVAFETRHPFRFVGRVAVILERRQTDFRINYHIALGVQVQNKIRPEITRLSVFVAVLDIHLRIILHPFAQPLVLQQLLALAFAPVALVLRVMRQRPRQFVRGLRRERCLLQQMFYLFLHRGLHLRLRHTPVRHCLLHVHQVRLQGL